MIKRKKINFLEEDKQKNMNVLLNTLGMNMN
jgi:hypothetical protein